MDWLISLIVLVVALSAMPMLVRWIKRTKGPHAGSGIGAIGRAFNEAFDPAAARSQEAREIKKLVGDHRQGENGDGSKKGRASPTGSATGKQE